MVGVDALDAHARLVAGDKGSLAQSRKSLPLLFLESARRANEHFHQRALADRQAKQIEENLLQPLVRQSVTGFHVNRQRMNARPERRSLRDCRQSRGRRLAAMGTTKGETPMPPYEWLNGRKLDLVIFADQFSLGVRSKCLEAMRAMRGSMIFEGVQRFA